MITFTLKEHQRKLIGEKITKSLGAMASVPLAPSELTNTIEQFIVYVHQNEAHFNYIYVYHTNVSEADNIYKNPPPNVISPIFLLFLFSSGAPPMTLLTAGALTDPQLPATASICARLMQGWVASAGWPPPPNKNPGYAGVTKV